MDAPSGLVARTLLLAVSMIVTSCEPTLKTKTHGALLLEAVTLGPEAPGCVLLFELFCPQAASRSAPTPPAAALRNRRRPRTATNAKPMASSSCSCVEEEADVMVGAGEQAG